MRVFGYTWAGVRTADLKAATQFFADVLGLSPIQQRDHMAQFEMPSGQLFEIFGSANRYFPLHTCPVLAFQVDDVRVESRAIECITEIEGSESEAWFYFRGPDGILYEMWQTLRPLNATPCR